MADAHALSMKSPQTTRPKLDLRSIAVQTTLELAAGGIAFAAFLHWMEM